LFAQHIARVECCVAGSDGFAPDWAWDCAHGAARIWIGAAV